MDDWRSALPRGRDGGQDDDIFFATVTRARMPMVLTNPNLPDNPIIYCNPAFVAMTGYPLAEIIGRNCRFLQGADTDPTTVAMVREAIAAERDIAVELLNYRKDGTSFWNALFLSPVHDAQGALKYYFSAQLDVSRRREAEASLRQAQKMEAIGQLTGGIAHDFNNLLTVVRGYADLLLMRLEGVGQAFDPAQGARQVRAIVDAAERGATLTQQLLAFARRQKHEGRIVAVGPLIRAMLPLIESAVGEAVTIDLRVADERANARIDPVQMEMAILNLAINAKDAMPDGGRLVIDVQTRQIAGEDAAFGTIAPGDYVAVAVTDTGTGMAPDIMRRVTEPFFTTKGEGKGTGLGLSMVFGFVEQSQGAFRLYSEEGLGTTVRLYFPAVTGDADRLAAPTRAPDRRGQERVLLVEDQRAVGDLAEALLTESGYRVVRAETGDAALKVLEADPSFDLLFTDLIMPGTMNGVTLARRVRDRVPGIAVLLTTGYADNAIERVDRAGLPFKVIDKPYKRSELLAAVRGALAGAPGESTISPA